MSLTCHCNERGADGRDKWGQAPGPWQKEPDRVDFEHLGLPCLIHRSHMGNWCGYAAVPPGHPLHGKHYDDVDMNVHGGLTYSGECAGCLCHTPKPGEPDNVWWFGFDFAHCFDALPYMIHLRQTDAEFRKIHENYEQQINRLDEGVKTKVAHLFLHDHYWTMEEAMQETRGLAEQLVAAGKSP